MYTQLLAIIDLVVKQAIITTDHFESEFVSKTFTLNPFPCYCAFFFLVWFFYCTVASISCSFSSAKLKDLHNFSATFEKAHEIV